MIRSDDSHGNFRVCARKGGSERGAVAIIVAVSMFALVALILLAVQVGTIGTVRALLQGSADEAAMAGASQLDGTDAGLSDANTQAMSILSGGKNFPSAMNEGSDLSIAGDAFETGTWDLLNPQNGFTPSTDAEVANAVRVRGRKLSSLNGPVDMFLGGVFGPDTVGLFRTGIAALGVASSTSCPPDLPIAICKQEIPCGEKIRILQTPSPVDNAGWWTFPEDVSVNSNELKGLVKNCGTVPKVRTGECINLGNGQNTSVYQKLSDRLKEYNATHACGSGNVLLPDPENPSCESCGVATAGDPIDINGDGVVNDQDCGMPTVIPMIPCDANIANDCSNDPDTLSNFNQARQVSGFVYFVITAVKDQASPKYVDGYGICGVTLPDTPTGPGPSCSPTDPSACATEPILVNANLRD
ncbi:MAG: pilus assembly protein [Deltaproteobacteria bacterium]|nr:pilus assembly protein [Deltaproteobacteria bacterium]